MERIGKREKKGRTHTIHGHDNTHVPFWLHLALHRTGSKCQFHIPGPSQPAEKMQLGLNSIIHTCMLESRRSVPSAPFS